MEGMSCRSAGLLFSLFSLCLGTLPHKRFEYKLSFKGPHLVQKDGSVPFWDYGGDAIASDDNIRITPSLRSKKGWVWTRNSMSQSNWMIEVTFRVSGRGRIGADGLAIWYTAERVQGGPVYGSKDYWRGLGVFFDSFDNDAMQNNPYILGVVNDGTKAYDHQRDGSSQMLGGCLRDFRNKPYPIRAKIEYNKELLTIQISNGMTNEPTGYELCFQAAGIKLATNGYFGVSAATGGLADDHDVLAFSTYSYTYPEVEQGKDSFSDLEREKYEKEFREYQDQLKKAREEYQKEHPEAAKEDPYDVADDKWFEAQGERELNNIYVGQNNILEHIRNLDRKMDEVIGRQERVIGMFGQAGQGGQLGQGANQGGGNAFVDTMTRPEVDRVFMNHKELSRSMEELKQILAEMNRRSQAVSDSGAGGGIGNQLVLHEIKDRIAMVKSDTENLIARPGSGNQPCPPPSPVSCLNPVYFYLFMIAQIAVFIGYSIYRQNKEAQAKKFY